MNLFFLFLFFFSTSLAWGNRFEMLDQATRTLSASVNSLIKKSSLTIEKLKEEIAILQEKNKELKKITKNQHKKNNSLYEFTRPTKRSSSVGRISSQQPLTIRTIFEDDPATIFGDDKVSILDTKDTKNSKKSRESSLNAQKKMMAGTTPTRTRSPQPDDPREKPRGPQINLLKMILGLTRTLMTPRTPAEQSKSKDTSS